MKQLRSPIVQVQSSASERQVVGLPSLFQRQYQSHYLHAEWCAVQTLFQGLNKAARECRRVYRRKDQILFRRALALALAHSLYDRQEQLNKIFPLNFVYLTKKFNTTIRPCAPVINILTLILAFPFFEIGVWGAMERKVHLRALGLSLPSPEYTFGLICVSQKTVYNLFS